MNTHAHSAFVGISQYARILWLFIAGTCIAAMGYALYAEHILKLAPCNLCMLQRGSMISLGVIALIACLYFPKQRLVRVGYAILGDIAAISGVILAGRHVWLQHLPKDRVPACGPPFDYLVSQFPITEVIQEIFSGSGDCAEVQWQLLGFSMPELLLGLFIGLSIACGLQLILAMTTTNALHE